MTTSTDLPIRQWWLRQLSEEEAARVEEALFADAALVETADDVRRDVLDDFAAGRLTADERRTVAEISASERGRQQLAVARAIYLKHQRQRHANRRRFVTRLSALAAVLVLVVVGVWFSTRDQIDRLPTLSLRATAQRAAAPLDVTLPPNDGTLRLQTEIIDAVDARRYRLLIADKGVTVYESALLPVRRVDAVRFVEAAVPAVDLAPGAHRIIVRDEGNAETYSWDVNVRAR